jgi:hypothetical protein
MLRQKIFFTLSDFLMQPKFIRSCHPPSPKKKPGCTASIPTLQTHLFSIRGCSYSAFKIQAGFLLYPRFLLFGLPHHCKSDRGEDCIKLLSFFIPFTVWDTGGARYGDRLGLKQHLHGNHSREPKCKNKRKKGKKI